MKPIPTVTVNVANINMLAVFVESAKFKFDMGRAYPGCKSAGCIGGHAAALWPEIRTEVPMLGYTWNTKRLAKKLGITLEQERRLCFPYSGDTEEMRERINRADAVQALRRLALTGVVDWGSKQANEIGAFDSDSDD